MRKPLPDLVEQAKQAAQAVLRRNAKDGRFAGLPRTAGWGYPEPYTRDLMISFPGVLVSGDKALLGKWRKTLTELAANQTGRGHIPSLAHDPGNLGASDTTPLFLIGLALFREATGEAGFLDDAAALAMSWMLHQSPEDCVMVAQQPTSDWRDEQWVLGYGLYVNALFHWALTLHHKHEEAEELRSLMNRLEITGERKNPHRHEGLVIPRVPYYAMWAYKTETCGRFDLLGNSLAILTGIASHSRAREMTAWVERECDRLGQSLPPCLIPFVQPEDPDWRPRYAKYNRPGEYHNGGIWPFICGFYIAALVAAGRHRLARTKLGQLAALVKTARDHDVEFGFNEWYCARESKPRGEDWQTWSAAAYLYAVECVRSGETLFFPPPRDGI
jgi:hypothetical protein